jgi:RecB family exonuclease
MSPVEISFSRVQAYDRCPWLYHLVYDEGRRSGPNASMAIGQSLHRTLDAYFSTENSEHTLDRLLELYDQFWMNEGFASPQETLEAYDRGRKMLEHFFQIDRNRQSRVEATEKEFEIDLGNGVAFKGTIDRLDRAPDGAFEIVEYKTHGDKWTDDRIANDLQMTLYALGLSQLLKEPKIRLKYYFLSSGETKETTRTPEQLAAAETRLRTIAGKIRAKEFAPNHAYCGRCEFGKRCSNFKPGIST